MTHIQVKDRLISCLIFDLDGTLYDSSNGYVDHFRRQLFDFMYTKGFVSSLESAEDVWRPLFEKCNQSYKALVNGGFIFDRDEYWRHHRKGVEVRAHNIISTCYMPIEISELLVVGYCTSEIIG